MAAEDIVLRFDLYEDRTPDAERVAHALLAYIDILKTAAALIDPRAELRVGLAGVEDGSDIFKLSLQRLETIAGQVQAGASEFPLVSKAALALAGMTATSALGVLMAVAFTPDPRIPEDQIAVFQETNRLLSESNELERERQRFYGILQAEPAIKQIDVMRGFDKAPLYSVPRSDFAGASGLWSGEEGAATGEQTIPRSAVWDVVLIKPVLVGQPRTWRFARDGIEFGARMDDEVFLGAIRDKTLKIVLSEGVRMRIGVTYRERVDGDVAVPVPASHRVTHVYDPLPPAPATALFPRAD